MKKIFFAFLLFLVFPTLSNADTIPNWTAYLNKKELKSATRFVRNAFHLKFSELKQTDALSIRYFDQDLRDDINYEIAIISEFKYDIIAMPFKNGEVVEISLTKMIEENSGSFPKFFKIALREVHKNKSINHCVFLTFVVD